MPFSLSPSPSRQVPHGREYAAPPAPVAALAIVMAGGGFACDGSRRQALCRGASFFVPARTAVVYSNNNNNNHAAEEGGAGAEAEGAGEGASRATLWVCLARSNLNYRSGL